MSVVAQRLEAQGLTTRPARTVGDVVHRLLAVQAQDLRGARLAVRARSQGLHSTDLDTALASREVVVSWLNRGTLHLVEADDYWWLHDLTTPQLLTQCLRRLQQEQVPAQDAERSVALVERSLADGPLTRPQLREILDAAGIRTQGQALVHQLFLATLRGHVVRGPMVGAEQAFVLVRDWLGRRPKHDKDDKDSALQLLAGRYLAGHGPADAGDLARWAGITLGAARTALASVRRARTRPDGLVEPATARDTDRLPEPALLGQYEPVLLGWTSREDILRGQQSLVTSNGLFRPFAMVGGAAVASWRFTAGTVSVQPFQPLPDETARALAREAEDVERYLAPAPDGRTTTKGDT